MKKTKEKLYCGDSFAIGDDYTRRGSQFECMRKGYGSALHRNSDRNTFREQYTFLGKRTVSLDEDRKYGSLKMYQDFLNENFNTAKNASRNLKLGDVFTQLAIMWREKYKQHEEEKEEDEDVEEKYEVNDRLNQQTPESLSRIMDDIQRYDKDIAEQIDDIEQLFSNKELWFRQLKVYGDIKKNRKLTLDERTKIKDIIKQIVNEQYSKDIEKTKKVARDRTKTRDEKIRETEKIKKMFSEQYQKDTLRIQEIFKK
jgi:hypothetical protein